MDFLLLLKRPIVQVTISIILIVYLMSGENWLFCILLLLCFIWTIIFLKTPKKQLIILVIIIVIFGSYTVAMENYLKDYCQIKHGENTNIKGIITTVHTQLADKVTVTIKEKGIFSPKIKLTIYDLEEDLYPGLHITASGTFLQPAKRSNPGGYDEEKNLFANFTYGKVVTYASKTSINQSTSIRGILGRWYYSIIKRCEKFLGKDYGEILSGMLIGAKESIDKDIVTLFRVSGLSHTMAVSGSHVMYLMAPLIFIFTKLSLKRRRYYPIIAFILIVFCMLTCMKPSVVRATIMALCILGADYFYEQYNALNALCFSALCLLISNPLVIYDVGFILSFTCVLSILLFYSPINKLFKKNVITSVAILTFVVQLGVTIVSGKIFYTIYSYSFIVNLLVFPVRMVVTIFGWLMIIIPFVGHYLSVIVFTLLDYILIIASYFSSLPLATISLPYISPFLVSIYFLLIITLLYSKNKKASLILLVILIFTIIIPYITKIPLRVVFFDVGQGDCHLIQTKKVDIVIDTGPYAPANSLSHFTGHKIDYLMLTHSHEDHIGGVKEILKRFKILNIVIPDVNDEYFIELEQQLVNTSINIIRVSKGEQLLLENMTIDFFNPIEKDYENTNNTSLVLKISFGELSLLFTGDCEKQVEEKLLEIKEQLNCDILKVAHHGSDTSTELEFYQAVDPLLSVISVGYNKFGHPSKEILKRLKNYMRTDEFGAIMITYNNRKLSLTTVKK